MQMMGNTICKDDSCRGFGGFHASYCKVKEIKAQADANRDVAIRKGFISKMEKRRDEVKAVRALVQKKYNGDLCKIFNRKGIPCKDCRGCKKGPCKDLPWHNPAPNVVVSAQPPFGSVKVPGGHPSMLGV